jgi:HNH endonuclease
MKTIMLTRGYEAIVDDDDFDELSKFTWHAVPSGSKCQYVYAERSEHIKGTSPQRVRHVKMHRQILPMASVVDHANGNTLDNRRCNLRACSRSQNVANQAVKAGRFKGVGRWGVSRWRARCGAGNNPESHIGVFDSEVAAAIAYDVRARVKYGAFAKLNFPFGAG